jgi:hypothetical protein
MKPLTACLTRGVTILATTTCLSVFVQALDMPPMKEGLWKIHTVDTFSNAPGQDSTYSLCRNHAYDDSVRALAKKVEAHCKSSGESTTGNSHSVTMTCDIAGYHSVTAATYTVSENSSHSETNTTMTVSGQNSVDKSIQDQTYLGACPADMSPGDRKLPDGTIQKHH